MPQAGDDVVAVLAALRRFRRADDEMRRRASSDLHLNISDLNALQYVMETERTPNPATPGMIAAHLSISTASTTKMLDRLAAAGHLERLPHPHDRRSLVLRATPHAHEEIRGRLGPMFVRLAEIAASVPEGCRDAVVAFLDAVSDELDRTSPPRRETDLDVDVTASRGGGTSRPSR